MPSHEDLSPQQRRYHRDQLRAARYSALADAEGFGAICFAIEALGVCLLEEKRDLGKYYEPIKRLAANSITLSALADQFPTAFTRFEPLYNTIKRARNDAMHSGIYARHATAAAIELCIGLEEAIMRSTIMAPQLVKDLMVKTPVTVEMWQPIALARQLMLMHSFSFLPVFHGTWKLLSEVALVKYLSQDNFAAAMGRSIDDALTKNLVLLDAIVVAPEQRVPDLLANTQVTSFQSIWLVQSTQAPRDHLDGILSPFELM